MTWLMNSLGGEKRRIEGAQGSYVANTKYMHIRRNPERCQG